MSVYAEHRVTRERRTYALSEHDSEPGWYQIVAFHDDDEPGLPSQFWDFGTLHHAQAAWSLITRG